MERERFVAVSIGETCELYSEADVSGTLYVGSNMVITSPGGTTRKGRNEGYGSRQEAERGRERFLSKERIPRERRILKRVYPAGDITSGVSSFFNVKKMIYYSQRTDEERRIVAEETKRLIAEVDELIGEDDRGITQRK